MRGSATGEEGAPPPSAREERRRGREGGGSSAVGEGSAVGRRVTRETRGDFSFFISRGIAGWVDG